MIKKHHCRYTYPQLSFSNEPDFEIDWAHYDSDGTIKLGHLFGEAVAEHIK